MAKRPGTALETLAASPRILIHPITSAPEDRFASGSATCYNQHPMKMKFLLPFAAASLVLASTALADKPVKEIVGKWADSEGVGTLEYKADGTYIEKMGGETMKGKYSFPDDTHIKVEVEGPMAAAGPMISAITVKGDDMDLTAGEGVPATHYKRQK